MAFKEENINPDSWKPEEMLKHVYRELLNVQEELSKIRENLEKDTRYTDLKKEVDDLRADFKVEQGKKAAAIWVMGVVITIASIVIQLLSSGT